MHTVATIALRACISLVAVPLLGALSLTACTSAPKPTPSAAMLAPAIKPVETFDATWTIVRDSHFDASLNGVDWNQVRAELRPRAEAARTQGELHEVLDEMLERLGQSHFAIIPAGVEAPAMDTVARQATPAEHTKPQDDSGLGGIPHAVGAGEPVNTPPAPVVDDGPGVSGLDIALVDGEPTVLRVTAGLSAARSGVLTGWRLVSVDGVRVTERLAQLRGELAREVDANSPNARRLRAMLAVTGAEVLTGEPGTRREAVFVDASGAEQKVAITFEPSPLGSTKYGNLPAFPIEVTTRIVEMPAGVAADGGKPVRIGVIAFNIWMTGASDAIDRAVDSMRNCDGIVLDLRGNPGGLGAMSMGVAGHFLREPASLGSMIGRENTLEFTASPRKVSTDGKRVRPYATKPLAILIDGRSASTSEVFAGGLQALGRARVFGENSAGMALPAQAVELPNGDVLLHAVADFVTSKGTRLEGRGVIPDEPVSPTRAALLRGDDPALLAANRWISASTLEARAARTVPGKPPAGMPDSVLMPNSMPTAMPSLSPTAMPAPGGI